MQTFLTQEKISQLRQLLRVDVLPKIMDQESRVAVTNHFLAAANKKTQALPKILAIGGGPGSGKSLFCENLKMKKQLPKDAVLHDPDLVMKSIPQYRAEANKDPVKAFKNWELPALQLANEILLNALIARYNIIYQRTFALPESLKFIHFAKAVGYQVHTHMLICEHDIVLARAKEREKITKRHIPSEILLQRHEVIAKLLPDIENASDSYFCYENNEDGVEPVLKFSCENSSVE